VLADVLMYLRTAWGHSASPVTAEQVAKIRATLTEAEATE